MTNFSYHASIGNATGTEKSLFSKPKYEIEQIEQLRILIQPLLSSFGTIHTGSQKALYKDVSENNRNSTMCSDSILRVIPVEVSNASFVIRSCYPMSNSFVGLFLLKQDAKPLFFNVECSSFVRIVANQWL